MKKKIHPNWNSDAAVTCSCGNKFTTGSINKTIEVDICSACHPFFTGEMKFVDRQGRVDRFMAKMRLAEDKKKAAAGKKAKIEEKEEQKSYQDILREQRANLKKAEKAEKTEEKKAESSEN
jgi:large subunit ribosomal protein L31